MQNSAAESRQKAIDKIQKILARVNSSNIHEAELAKNMAKKFMLKHGLTEADFSSANQSVRSKKNSLKNKKETKSTNQAPVFDKAFADRLKKTAALKKESNRILRFGNFITANEFLKTYTPDSIFSNSFEYRLLALRCRLEEITNTDSFLFSDIEKEFSKLTSADPRGKPYYQDILFICGLLNLKKNNLEVAKHYLSAANKEYSKFSVRNIASQYLLELTPSPKRNKKESSKTRGPNLLLSVASTALLVVSYILLNS